MNVAPRNRKMTLYLLRTLRHIRPIGQRAVTGSAVTRPGDIQMDEKTRNRVAPKIGNRDIVGYGFNGNATYWDMRDFPCSAIRFGENTPEVLALRQKEKGDWKNLTIPEMKALYRSNFCQTYAEMDQPTGYLKHCIYLVFGIMTIGSFFNICMKQFFYSRYPLPASITPEWQEKMLERMVNEHQGKAHGVASLYDYENEKWK